MGHAYPYQCGHCGFEQNFYHGHGHQIHSQPLKQYFNQPSILFHYKVHNLLKQLFTKYNDLFIRSGFQVYKCPECRFLFDKVEVVVFDSEKVLHKSRFRCPHCSSRLKLTNIHRLKKTVCPRCHKTEFKQSQIQQELWK
jgi:ribosomal protein S27AE